jgi:hypothetical protein
LPTVSERNRRSCSPPAGIEPTRINQNGDQIMNKIKLLATLATLTLAGTVHAAEPGYAEGIYRDYAKATAGAVKFKVSTMESGSLQELAGQPLSHFLGTPSYSLSAENAGLSLENVQFDPVTLKSGYLADLDNSVDGFNEVGFPVENGQYRLLEVRMTVGKDRLSHIALEACWPAQGHCVVFDPSVEFVDSEVQNLRTARASGWAVQIHGEPADQGLSKAGTCGLASAPWMKSRSSVWPAMSYTWKNLYGMTVVTKNIGRVESGMRCDASCRPQPWGSANASSAWAQVGFSVACHFASRGGTSGNAGKFIAKSGCSHRTLLGAKLTLSAYGQGLSVGISEDVVGQPTVRGGSFEDRCAIF